MKIKKDDTVLIIKGRDRGRKGKVLQALPQKGKIIVEGINLIKKHIRPKKAGQKGEKVEIPAALAISKAKLICSKCSQPTRVGYKITKSGKLRICKKCEQET